MGSPHRFFALACQMALSTLLHSAQVDPEWQRQWDAAQVQRPRAPATVSRIASVDEPGVPLIIRGQVFRPDGATPEAGAVVFAYHTDTNGVYGVDEAGVSWRLKGWVKTGPDGRFEFLTIRPGPYPGRREPAHVHLTIESSRYGRQWAESLLFADDPLVTPADRARSAGAGRFAFVLAAARQGSAATVEFAVRLKPGSDF